MNDKKHNLWYILAIGMFLILVCGVLLQSASATTGDGFYIIPVMTLTNSPLDGVTNYFGNRPVAPVTQATFNRVWFPTAGTVERVEIYDYSGTAGSNEQYRYYIRVNNANEYLIDNLSVAVNERRFSNSSAIFQFSVNAGDYFEIKRVHPNWGVNPATNIVGGYVAVNANEPGYLLPFQAMSNSPLDSIQNFIGWLPTTPSSTQGLSKLYVPVDGNISRYDLYENNSGASPGTNEDYMYFLHKNGGMDVRSNILNLNNVTERMFNNTAMWLMVNQGDYVQLKRQHPAWTVNPLLNIVGGGAFVNTSYSHDLKGYALFFQAISNSPVDAQTTFFGNMPKAPNTAIGQNKVYVPRSGILNRAELYTYSSTAGTAERWDMGLVKNNVSHFNISYTNITTSERMFRNGTMNISVNTGDYLEIESIQPTWATNPASSVYGGYVWIDTAVNTGGACPTPTAAPAPPGVYPVAANDSDDLSFVSFVLIAGIIAYVVGIWRGKK